MIATLLIHLALTWVMVGIIWFNQMIHYPLYHKIKDGFTSYERSYLRRTIWLMGPVMILEVLTALLLIGLAPTPLLIKLATANFVALTIIWISTCIFQVQQHQKLSVHYSKKIHHMLLSTNWIRTILWTARGFLVLYMVTLL
ncbi:MAG: hypothetical protein H7A40_02865 [Chlamydiales bacterium]|nr:hypothetical protein [Chlamydiales bacterium]